MHLDPEPYGDTYSAIGGTYSPWNFIYANWVNCKRLTATDAMSVVSRNIENSMYVDSLGVRSTRYMVKMPNNRIENATAMSTKDLYDFIKNLTICKYTNKDESNKLDDGNSYTFGIYNADNYADSGDSIAGGIFRKLYDVSNGNPVRVGSGYIQNALLCALIGAFQQYIGAGNPGDGGDDPSNPDYDFDDVIELLRAEHVRVETTNGQKASLNVKGVVYVTDTIRSNDLMETNTLSVNTIKFSDNSELTSANGLSGGGVTPGPGNVFDTITVRKIIGPDRGEGQYNRVDFEDGIGVSHIFCNGEDENRAIFIGDHVSLHAGMTIFEHVTLEEDGYIEFPDGSRLTSANGLSGGSGGGSASGIPNGVIEYIQQENSSMWLGTSWVQVNNDLNVDGNLVVSGNLAGVEALENIQSIIFADGTTLSSANGSGSSTDNITANKITIGTPTDNKASRCSLCVKGNALIEGTLYIEGSYTVNGTAYSDKSLKENIRYIDTPITYSNDDLEKADLYDFIVNQVNICEYNFIDDDRDKIGFIANDYEGTKVGDKIVFRNEETDLLGYDSNNLLFATIGALQEEVRIRDEKIATLEDRLARIEALLGINNNDN
jgi:hypothetical protein